jgi:hypothetical protein
MDASVTEVFFMLNGLSRATSCAQPGLRFAKRRSGVISITGADGLELYLGRESVQSPRDSDRHRYLSIVLRVADNSLNTSEIILNP